jgi:hypothetical protein
LYAIATCHLFLGAQKCKLLALGMVGFGFAFKEVECCAEDELKVT